MVCVVCVWFVCGVVCVMCMLCCGVVWCGGGVRSCSSGGGGCVLVAMCVCVCCMFCSNGGVSSTISQPSSGRWNLVKFK